MKAAKQKRKRDLAQDEDTDEETDYDEDELLAQDDKSEPKRRHPGSVHFPFFAGAPMLVAGPTWSGKTWWVWDVLECQNSFTQPVEKILYCYGVYQKSFNTMKQKIPNITFHKGLPKLKMVKEFTKGHHFTVIVLDDLMEKVLENTDAQQLFTKYCHHYSFSTIFVTQNVFAAGKCARNIALNTLILVLFPNYRDRSQIHTLARQVCPSSPSTFVNVFETSTAQKYGYLIVDCTPLCREEHRWRTNIFSADHATGTYYVQPRCVGSAFNLVTSSKRARKGPARSSDAQSKGKGKHGRR